MVSFWFLEFKSMIQLWSGDSEMKRLWFTKRLSSPILGVRFASSRVQRQPGLSIKPWPGEGANSRGKDFWKNFIHDFCCQRCCEILSSLEYDGRYLFCFGTPLSLTTYPHKTNTLFVCSCIRVLGKRIYTQFWIKIYRINEYKWILSFLPCGFRQLSWFWNNSFTSIEEVLLV